jgi:uncharacterized protein (TIGR02271 family)
MSGFLDKLGLGHNKTEDEIAREAGKAHTVTHQKAAASAGPGVVTTQTTTTTEKAGPTLRSAARTGSSSSSGWQGTTLSREQELAEQTRLASASASSRRENIGESNLFTQHTGITGNDSAMTRSEEHLRVMKEQVASGKAELNKYVTVEHVEQQVPVTRERIVIEREPINAANWDSAMAGPEISEAHYETLLTEEHIHAEKEVVPVERIRLAKQVEQASETVGADLRREHIDLSVTKLPGEVIGHSSTTEILGAGSKSEFSNLQTKSETSGFGTHLKTDTHGRALTNEERIAQARKEESGF